MFGAGDLESSKPYGLTSAEKVIVKNKKILKKTEKQIKKTDSILSDHSDRIEALESILDSESIKLNKVYLNSNKHFKDFDAFVEKTTFMLNKNSQYQNSNSLQVKQLNENIENLQFQIDQDRENIKILKQSFDKMVILMNKINDNFVSKKEFKKLITILDKRAKSKKVKVKSKKSNKELLSDARKLFKKDNFTKALPIFKQLIKVKHRPAECNYYVGEINYYRGNYQDALYHFKISMKLYDKAKYLPKLLLHSAISFEKTGDNENAQNFYNTLVDVFPKSAEAKEASKKIK